MNFDTMTAENLDNFSLMWLMYQLLPQVLTEQFDTLASQYRNIEHMHEGVWFPKNVFDTMTAMKT